MGSRLQGKVCLVTGASSGIGRAIALAFAREGAAYVLCADLRSDSVATSAERSEQLPTHELITKEYGEGRAGFFQANVTKEVEVLAMITAVVRHAKRLDVLVNNAGVGPAGRRLHETPDHIWTARLDTNLRGPFLCSKHATKQFLVQEQLATSGKRGCIINIASAGALRELKFAAAYSASKSGVISLSKTTTIEYGSDKIQCNAICPGTVLTPMTSPMLQNQDVAAHLRATVPWGEGGLTRGPDEIADAAIWLASEEAGWVTGVTLPVDGGFAIHP